MNENSLDNDIKVSVIVITYNHEKYIRQALDSILMQKVDFKYEVLIGDDASIDSTPDILKEYKRKYPDKISLFLRKENLGGTRNSYELFTRAQGQYIAMLEGDDYWTEELKVQKQTDFLDKNKEFAGCVSEFEYIDADGNPYPKSEEKILRHNLYCTKQVYTLKEFNMSKLASHSSTLVYRNIYKKMDTSILYKAHRMIGDCTIMMLILSKGNIYKIEEPMSNYRYDRKSSSWTSSEHQNPFLPYNTFKYYNDLERYGREKLKLKVDLKNYKVRYFYYMAYDWMRYPTKSRYECIRKMLSMTPEKLYYLRILWDLRYIKKIGGVTMQALIDGSYKKEKITWNDFKEFIEGKKVVLFGTGGGCREYLDGHYFLTDIAFAVDNDLKLTGKYIYGIKIFQPDILRKMDPENTVVLIVVGDNYIDSIKAQVREYGMKHIYSYCHIECNDRFYDRFREKYENKLYIKNA